MYEKTECSFFFYHVKGGFKLEVLDCDNLQIGAGLSGTGGTLLGAYEALFTLCATIAAEYRKARPL